MMGNWDIVVRMTHWLVALCCALNIFAWKAGSLPHQVTGYVACGLVFSRLIWAMTGAKSPARLRDMIPSVEGARAHIQEMRQRQRLIAGHNSFGLLAIWTMWTMLIALGVTGYLAALTTDTGGLFPVLSNSIEEIAYDYDWAEIHAIIIKIFIALAMLHIFAAVLTNYWLRTGKAN